MMAYLGPSSAPSGNPQGVAFCAGTVSHGTGTVSRGPWANGPRASADSRLSRPCAVARVASRAARA